MNNRTTSPKKKNCFFLTPIGEEKTSTREKMEVLYARVILQVFQDSYNITVAHRICEPGKINEQILKHIRDDDLVIANLTELNSNVMLELGIRYGLNKPAILIAENNTKLPFDLFDERTFFYSPDENGYIILCDKLKQAKRKIIYSYNMNRKFRNYEGRWLEITLDFPERPVSICKLSYVSAQNRYEFQGHNYHYNDSGKDVDFESNTIIESSEERDSFYYITQPIILDNTVGFGKINFFRTPQDGLMMAEGYFVDISNSDSRVDTIKKTKMIKCDKKFFDLINLKCKRPSDVTNNQIIEYAKKYLKDKFKIEVFV